MHCTISLLYPVKILTPLTRKNYTNLIGNERGWIYTSSYLGVYERIFQRMNIPRGDSLVMRLHGDFLARFIKMAAAYNKLDHFLPPWQRQFQYYYEGIYYRTGKSEWRGRQWCGWFIQAAFVKKMPASHNSFWMNESGTIKDLSNSDKRGTIIL